jgi:hypothetical protein
MQNRVLFCMDRDVVLAREVSGMHGVLTIRDPTGLPLWDKKDMRDGYKA